MAVIAALLERELELARIERAMDRTAAGEGSLVIVEGPAGIGKSAILAAVRATASASGIRVLRARGAELERDFAFGVVRQLFEPALADIDPADRAELFGGHAGLAGELLGLPGAPVTGDAPGAGARPDPSFAVLHGLYWLSANLSSSGPVLLCVDDAHWADTSSLRFLSFLAPRLDELCVTLVIGARSGESGAASDLVARLAVEPGADVVHPAPLTALAVGRLLEEGLGTTPDPAFVTACEEATGGIPFLVRQLVTALSEGGIEPTAAAATEIETLGARTVARWVLVRLGSMPPAAAKLARAVAVLEQASLPNAAALADLEPDAAADAADRLVAAGILEPDRPLAFVHPVVRAGVYAEISTAHRASAHRRAAGLLAVEGAPPERIAEHLMASDPAGDAWVAEALSAAADSAAQSGAPESAAVYLRRALREPAPFERRGQMLLDLGVYTVRADQPDAHEHLENAIKSATDDDLKVKATRILSTVLLQAQESVDALALVDRVLPTIDPAREDLSLKLELTGLTGAVVDAATAWDVRPRTRDVYIRALQDPHPTRELLGLIALLSLGRGDPQKMPIDFARRAFDAGPSSLPDDPTDMGWFSCAALALVWGEDFEYGRRILDQAVARARAVGDGPLLSIALSHRSWLELRAGDLTAAEADAVAVLDPSTFPTAPPLYRLMAGGVLGGTLIYLGRFDEAERWLETVSEDAEANTTLAGVYFSGRGLLRTAQRRADEAIADLARAGDILTRCGITSPALLPWRSEKARAHLLLGERETAEELARGELGDARKFGGGRALGVALHTVGMSTSEDDAEALLNEAIECFARAGVGVELASARKDLGALLRRQGRRAEAREHLRAALDGAHRASATILADQADIELRATGAKPRRTVLTGLESLTASERRVAELASDGMTNREIAQTLFVTARTVEGHLTHVFRKLGVESRDQLNEAFEQPVAAE